jgi:hypothetical protein
MIYLLGLPGTIFLLAVSIKMLITRPTFKVRKRSKKFIVYSLLVIGYAIYVCITNFVLGTKLPESRIGMVIMPYLLAFQLLWLYQQRDRIKN